MNIRTILLAATAVMALGTAASAVTTINVDQNFTGNALFDGTSGNVATFEFTAGEDLIVQNFIGVTGNGQNNGDLNLLEFGVSGATIADQTSTFTVIPTGGTAVGFGSLNGFTLAAGDSFTFTFTYADSALESASGQFSFDTLAAVPLPAGGLLLIGGLGALAATRKRKAAK